jgi:AAA domain-containing protein
MSDGFENVMPMRSEPVKLRPKAQAFLEGLNWAGEAKPNLDCDYLVKGWLDRGSLSVVYGPSNVGKSFLAVDLAHHITKGISWGGRRVRQGNVLYLAVEGGSSFVNRISALEKPEFWYRSLPLTMTGRDSSAQPLIEAIQHLSHLHGRYDLIVVDTMARVMGSGDENTAPDIADLLRNLDLIRRTLGANIMLVHHSGKDVARGARGHSSLRAAIDTEIELSRDDWGVITAEVTKQRDGPTGYKFCYTLRQIELGRDQDGDPVTTCLVEPTEPTEVGRAVVTGPALIALEILDKMIAADGETLSKPQYPGTPCVSFGDWKAACVDSGRLADSDLRDTHRRAFGREVEILKKAKLILVRDELIWRVDHG